MDVRIDRLLLVVGLMILVTGHGLADGPADNSLDQVRRVPKLGIDVPEADRAELTAGLQDLQKKIDHLRQLKSDKVNSLLPDVLIYHRAVDQALRYQELFDAKEIPIAKKLLQQGIQRADELTAGDAPWTRQTGTVVRGYISKLDQTVQPYGLVVPASYKFDGTDKIRLDAWFHGRGELLSELNFVNDRTRYAGPISPANTLTLHLYGRYCNANKLAGEVDLFEALDATKRQYRIDDDRISVRGFSMGGAAAWQFAVHYADQWFAANPGAGFSETPEFLKFFQKETLSPTVYEEKLWRMYDCPGYAANLAQLPTVAYSGDMDIQKQAADIMETAFEREGMKLLHIIGPMTGHQIHPESEKQIEAKLAEWALKGRNRTPAKVQLVTFTLKYNCMYWLTIDGMNEHWSEARVVAEPVDGVLAITTRNVSALSVTPPAGAPKQVRIDGGSALDIPANGSFVREGGAWKAGQLSGLRKKHGLQGPIDDALMDSFIFVKPSGKFRNEMVERWVNAEFEHAVTHWRRQMRGDAIVKLDSEITAEDVANSNLILWGDTQSNSVLAKIADRLPILWTGRDIVVGDRTFDAANHAPVAVYPNPLNPERYVVLNSSFTYREYDYLNNARQVPKLPDWAIVDLRTPPNARYPGKIVDADFFDERWNVKAR
ncbi:prolyl oligopeptidase family serine peptidase [Schlesneria paludicola]|uniref:prolyl oligopeptidase family serine peptidase n=1 Tax=Schlesneria paludicola TaxID=360056 RepID=UPI00029B3DAE|nr:prolyl oligopeptidase family serine peptidase [Schlesneria paludicola]